MTQTRSIDDAIAIASNWITSSDLSFSAAFIGGSVAYAPRDSTYDPASDIDCYLVIEGSAPDGKIGKLTIEGVLLDVSWIPWSGLKHAVTDAVLASLLNFGVVVQGDGKLEELQHRITTTFALPEHIEARLESMREKIRNGLAVNSSHLSHPEQMMNWLFPATLATHIPLVNACAPLTVRKRLLAAKKVMTPPEYETLLGFYGFDTVTPQQAQEWLDATTSLFDATAEMAETSARFWATDIQADARHIAIDGSQALINSGKHREALYWIIATSSRCLTVRGDANADSSAYVPAFNSMLNEMGIQSQKDRHEKSRKIMDWITS